MPSEPPSRPAPPISVITCVYNGERYLAQAIESVLAQTWTDFEYIVVDDASTDSSLDIITRHAMQDERLIALHNPVNLNVSGALNRALSVAKGEFLAILDQDDLALPERLACQRAFLADHPEVGVIGAQVLIVDSDGRPLSQMTLPTTEALAQWHILFGSPVLHSAVMLRHALVDQAGGYSVDQWHLNDYLLMSRLSSMTAITNLPMILTYYRRHPHQMASLFAARQRGQALLLIYSLLVERLHLWTPLAEIGELYDATRGGILPGLESLQRAAGLLTVIRARYLEIERPVGLTLAQINMDCARRWQTMARVHRHSYPDASRAILQQAFVHCTS